eukprot:1142851-Pelagomonas_calceolata.AAC.8
MREKRAGTGAGSLEPIEFVHSSTQSSVPQEVHTFILHHSDLIFAAHGPAGHCAQPWRRLYSQDSSHHHPNHHQTTILRLLSSPSSGQWSPLRQVVQRDIVLTLLQFKQLWQPIPAGSSKTNVSTANQIEGSIKATPLGAQDAVGNEA